MRYVFLVVSAAVCGLFLLFSSDIVAAQQGSNVAQHDLSQQRMEELNKKIDDIIIRTDKSIDRLHKQLDTSNDNIKRIDERIDGRILKIDNDTTNFLRDQRVEINKLKKDIDEQSDDLKKFRFLSWVAIVIATGVAGIASILTFAYQVWPGRKNEAKQQLEKLHSQMLKDSQTTITLVNETLNLAKQATASAMYTATRRTKELLEALDAKVSDLFKFGIKDSLEVIRNRRKNDELRTLFSELTAFEFSNTMLDEPLNITSGCMFLKAIQLSQDNQFQKAIETWRDILDKPSTIAGDDIKISCRYWIGHEQSKLGQFDDAERTYQLAYALAQGSKATEERRLELARLGIEARLAKSGGKEADDLLFGINAILAESDKGQGLQKFKVDALHTKGDIYFAAAFHAYRSGNKAKAAAYTREAKGLWKILADQGHTFAQREYSFACLALQEEVDEAQDVLERLVRDETKRLYTDCIGESLKVSYAMVQLMIAKAQHDDTRAQDMDTRANGHIADVHELEWPYSPLRKYPVSRHEFQEDVKWLSKNGLPAYV